MIWRNLLLILRAPLRGKIWRCWLMRSSTWVAMCAWNQKATHVLGCIKSSLASRVTERILSILPSRNTSSGVQHPVPKIRRTFCTTNCCLHPFNFLHFPLTLLSLTLKLFPLPFTCDAFHIASPYGMAS